MERMRFFAPLARRRRGSKKGDVHSFANVLWADMDSREALATVERELQPLGFSPSVVVDSGNKGFWIYLKLTKPIPVAQIESLNKRLAVLVGGDKAWNCDRIARLPGSIHPKSGNLARVVSFTGEVFDVERIEAALPADRDQAREVVKAGTAPAAPTLAPFAAIGARFPTPILSGALTEYVARCPRRGEGFDRSEWEQKIFVALVGQGWNDEQIIAYSNSVGLSKHVQEGMKRGDFSWTFLSLQEARNYVAANPSDPSLLTHMCKEPVPLRTRLDRDELLAYSHERTQVEIINHFSTRDGFNPKTVQRALNRFVDGGYITKSRQGHTFLCLHTEKTKQRNAKRFRPGLVVPSVSNPRSTKRQIW